MTYDQQYPDLLPAFPAVADDGFPVSASAISDHYDQSTTFFFSLTEANQVALELFDLASRKISTLIDAPLNAGEYRIHLESGSLASGLYFCRLSCGAQRSFLKVLIQK